MAEALPSLRFQQPVLRTEGGDLGGTGQNDWVSGDAGKAEERAYLSYSFNTASGYTTSKLDYSSGGQAIKFVYDLSQSVYARKRQFVLGAYAYVKRKSLSSSGSIPGGGSAGAYLAGSNECAPKQLKRSLSSYSYAETDVPFAQLQENAYNKVSRQYLYPQIGISGSTLYSDRDYTFDAEVIFSGAAGEHPPYLDVAAEDVLPFAENAAPQGIFADRTEDIFLRWTFAYDGLRYASFEGVSSQADIPGNVYGDLKQQAARVRWTDDNVSFHEIEVGEENTAVIPAGSVSADRFRWQVQLCSNDGVWGEYSDWFEVPTDNDSLSTAAALKPKNISIDGDSANVFSWSHQNVSGSRPTAAELQYSSDGQLWQTFHLYYGRDCSCEVPAGSLPSGSLQWRVRTCNASGVAGYWSEPVNLTVITKPATPQILFAGTNPLPEIHWSSEDQYSAEIDIDGVIRRVYGAEQSFRWESPLEAGSHSLRIRTQNRFALWSRWAQSSIVTVNRPLEAPLLWAEAQDNRVLLRWDESHPQALLYRNGQLIAKLTTEQSFCDDATASAARYRLRVLDYEGNYGDSNEVVAAPSLSFAAIGRGDSWLTLKGRYDAPVIHRCRATQQNRAFRVSGWQLPLNQPTAQWDIEHHFVFSLRPEEAAAVQQLKELAQELLVYKDCRGDCVKGLLTQLDSEHHGSHIELRFTLCETGEVSLC